MVWHILKRIRLDCLVQERRPHDITANLPFSKNPPISKVFRAIGLADELGSGMRNTYKYTRLYSGAEPEFKEGDVFRTVIPLSEAATATVGPVSGSTGLGGDGVTPPSHHPSYNRADDCACGILCCAQKQKGDDGLSGACECKPFSKKISDSIIGGRQDQNDNTRQAKQSKSEICKSIGEKYKSLRNSIEGINYQNEDRKGKKDKEQALCLPHILSCICSNLKRDEAGEEHAGRKL